jgi:hypothetical protein
MMYAVKVEYDTPTSVGAFTDIMTFPNVMAATAVFNALMIAYPFGKPIQVRSKKDKSPVMIEVISAALYQADASGREAMLAAVETGSAILMDQTGALDELDNNPN